MTLNVKRGSRPPADPLEDIAVALDAASIKATREGNSLVIKLPKFSTRVDVIVPENRQSHIGRIKYVIKVRTVLPRDIKAMLSTPERIIALNAMVSSGALTHDGFNVYVGSRLTISETESAWNIQFPLLLFAAIHATDSLLGAVPGALAGTDSDDSASAWGEEDFEHVESFLSRICVCTAGRSGLTAEFALGDGTGIAIDGDAKTALWKLVGDEPHPHLGGGLFCLLQLPHRVPDTAQLDEILMRLNTVEMESPNLPPHFGAWCRGRLGNNPAYVSFLSNELHSLAGIAVNMSVWARGRAMAANTTLASLGFRA